MEFPDSTPSVEFSYEPTPTNEFREFQRIVKCDSDYISWIWIIIIKQLVTQHMSVKNKLTNHSCGLATAVSDGKIC